MIISEWTCFFIDNRLAQAAVLARIWKRRRRFPIGMLRLRYIFNHKSLNFP